MTNLSLDSLIIFRMEIVDLWRSSQTSARIADE